MRVRDEWLLPVEPSLVRAGAVDPGRRAEEGATRRESAAGDVVVTSVCSVPTGARGVAAALVGTALTLHRTERWSAPSVSGAVTVGIEVRIEDRPLTADVAVRLDAVPGGSRCRVEGTVRARLPGVGGAVEKRFAAELLRALRTELARVPVAVG